MNKKLLLLVLLLLIAATAFAAAVPTAGGTAGNVADPTASAASPVELSPAAVCPGTASTSEAGEAAPEWLASSSCCRPQCAVDRDCDKICGKGLGVCRLVNSCCKACLCSAT
jgi:hypothetical protein